MKRITRNVLTGLVGRGKCLLLRTLGVALAVALTPTLALAAEATPAYTYCISHADDPACSPGGPAAVNDAVISDANNWAMQAGDFANTRYSQLKQIDRSNVNKLQVAWMFSTGVLRGHEGSPLVIGNNMYFVTPFYNNVFALI
jgi:glucose dehydrogenase